MFDLDDDVDRSTATDLDIALLNRTAARLTTGLPLSGILAEVVSFVMLVVDCDSCMVYVLEKDDLVLRASKNPHPGVVGRLKTKLGEGIAGPVAENRHPVALTERAYEDFRFKLFNESPEDRFEALLSVPIVSGGELVGVINIQNRAAHQYNKREISMIATLGFLAGSEIQMARLEDENAKLANKLESRVAVERAKSILQRNLRISEHEAYRTLQSESQRIRKSMKEVADAVILGEEVKKGAQLATGDFAGGQRNLDRPKHVEFKSGPSKV